MQDTDSDVAQTGLCCCKFCYTQELGLVMGLVEVIGESPQVSGSFLYCVQRARFLAGCVGWAVAPIGWDKTWGWGWNRPGYYSHQGVYNLKQVTDWTGLCMNWHMQEPGVITCNQNTSEYKSRRWFRCHSGTGVFQHPWEDTWTKCNGKKISGSWIH